MKYFLRTIFLGLCVLLLPCSAHAAVVAITHAPTTVAQQEQFYVDVTIDPQGKAFNAIQGSIVFSDDTLSFVRAETGSSNISLFIDPPRQQGNTVSFSGIIPGGFNGLINPFDPSHKNPGQIMRLVFVGKAAGEAQIIATGMTVADNDGQGTLEVVPDQRTFLSVSTDVAPSIYAVHDTIPPTITASVIQDTNINNGKYTLIINATDKQSGIDHVEVKEGGSDWQTVQSPYLLRDQTRQSILLVRAFDMAGNTSVVTINASAPSTRWVLPLILVIFLLSVVLYVFKRKRTIL